MPTRTGNKWRWLAGFESPHYKNEIGFYLFCKCSRRDRGNEETVVKGSGSSEQRFLKTNLDHILCDIN